MNKTLMTHFYYGDPNEEFSLKLAKTLLTAGADILEIGIPYTDPVCDGQIFQRACYRALTGGIIPPKVFDGIRKLRQLEYRKPLYLTSYYGPIFKIGVEKFVKEAESVGVTGLIVPDILLEEQEKLQQYCRKYGLSLIQFATVYSSRERLEKIINSSADLPAQAGFIYCVSLPGVTGDPMEKNKLVSSKVEGLFKLLKLLKSMTRKKILVGFGIKSQNDVKEMLSYGADGVIIGSAIANMYEKNIKYPERSLAQISAFIKDLKEGTIRRK